MQGTGLAGAPRSVILTHKENEAKSNELNSSHFLFLRFGWHSSKRCGLSTLGPVFLEKLNGFLSLWGWALGRAASPSWPFLGGRGERASCPRLCRPRALHGAPGSLSQHQAALDVRAWVPGTAGRWGRHLRGGRQPTLITGGTVSVRRQWEDLLAAGKGGSPGLGAGQL